LAEVHLWPVILDADGGLVERAYSFLDHEERRRADRFRFDWLRAAFVLSHAVLRSLLARYCDFKPSQLAFVYGPHGKPALTAGMGDIRFNMTHSGRVAAYALARGREVGVDIERHRHLVDLPDIAERFFSPQEHRALMLLPASDRYEAFFRCWVRKEAYIKALGRGLSVPLDSFQTFPVVTESVADKRDGCANRLFSWSIRDFVPLAGYSGAVVAQGSPCRILLQDLQPAHNLLEF
jgi:4'-phosphopantetheinyl transferase